MTLTTCSDCIYWKDAGLRDRGNGYCLRNAPHPSNDAGRTYWPRTKPDDGCGEGQEEIDLERCRLGPWIAGPAQTTITEVRKVATVKLGAKKKRKPTSKRCPCGGTVKKHKAGCPMKKKREKKEIGV